MIATLFFILNWFIHYKQTLHIVPVVTELMLYAEQNKLNRNHVQYCPRTVSSLQIIIVSDQDYVICICHTCTVVYMARFLFCICTFPCTRFWWQQDMLIHLMQHCAVDEPQIQPKSDRLGKRGAFIIDWPPYVISFIPCS